MADAPASAPPAAGSSPPAPAPAPAQQAAPAPAPTPGSKAFADMPAEQRHAQLRGPANPRARGYSPALEQREAAAARASGEPTQDQQQEPSAPAGEKVKVGRYEIDEKGLGEMMTRQAADDLKRATLPAAPEAYETKLPEGLQLPGGIEYKFDVNDPSMVAARNLAHAKGWSQQDFSDALAIFASHQAGQEATLRARSQAELAKAGVNVSQRVDSVGRWLDGLMGTKDAAPIKATLVTDAHLRFVEAVMNKISSQGSASFSQSHRVPADDKSTIPGYERMSFEQRRLAQDTLAARRGR